MKALFRWFCFMLAVCLASLMVLGWTGPGLKLLTAGIERLSRGGLTIGSVDGALLGSLQLEDVLISTPAVQVRLGRLASNWQFTEIFNKRLHVAKFSVGDVDILLPKREGPGVKSPADILLPKLAVPMALVVDTISVDNLRLLAADGSELTRIDHCSFGLSGAAHQFNLDDFSLTAPGYEGNLQGLLDTERDWYIELAGTVEYRDFGTGPFAGEVSLKGPLARLDTVVELQRPARGHIEGQIRELPDSFSWQAELALYDVQLADGHEILPEMEFTVTGTAEGELLSYGGKLEGKIDYLFFKDVSFAGEVHGNGEQLTFPEVTVANSRGKARLTEGLLSWKGGLSWHGRLELEKVDPALLDAAYPGAVSGELYSSGRYNRQAGLALDADFRNFAGTMRGYELLGHGRLQVDKDSVVVDDFQLRSGKAILKMDGRAESESGLYHWRDALTWKAGLRLADFDPALFFPGYSGTISTEVKSEGDSTAGTIRARGDITGLNGVLRGYPVNGGGSVSVVDKTVRFDDLFLKSGNSTVRITGLANDSLDLSVKIFSENIGEILEGARGALTIDTTVSGDRSSPMFEAAISAKGLFYQDNGISSLEGRLSGGTDRESPLTAQLEGQGLQTGALALSHAQFTLQGKPGKHTFAADLRTADGVVKLQGRGKLAEDYSWRGDIHDLDLSSSVSGAWHQDGVAPVAVVSRKAQLDALCLKSQEETICVSGEWLRDSGRWKAQANWKQLDLARLNKQLDLPEPVRGNSSAVFSAAGESGRFLSAEGRLEITDAGIGGSEGGAEWQALQVDTTVLTVNFGDRRLNTGLKADFVDGSLLEMTAQVPWTGRFDRDPATLPLQGMVRADLRNLAFIAPLTDYYLRPSGALEGALNISGTLLRPVADGRLALAGGRLDLPPLGITMKDVLFELTGSGNTLDILATASSGPGSVRAAGNLVLDGTGIGGDFHITGENFETTVLPEYEIHTTPDVRFVFDADGGRLTGKVTVPHAVLAPERMTDAVRASDDVIFIDGEREVSAGGWLFSTKMQIELGEDVRLNGYGVTGKLRGDLLVAKEPGEPMTGNGQISLVDGVYSIYGRRLSIERGRSVFAGGPIENPGIDVRAHKIVADKQKRNENIEVGVEVSGTADNLEFSLFSDPAMEESDILAYMVVGRARSQVGQQDESLLNSAAMAMGLNKGFGIFNELSGLLPVDEMYIEGEEADDMSLVVGKHLTEELFIGYGHNFFNQEGEVRIRYDLGSGFSVESRSTGDVTGADLLYSFEK